MNTPLITINEKATLQDALHKMRDNNIRKLPVITKKNQVVGMIFQTTIANVIRTATATTPRLLSPPVKAVPYQPAGSAVRLIEQVHPMPHPGPEDLLHDVANPVDRGLGKRRHASTMTRTQRITVVTAKKR